MVFIVGLGPNALGWVWIFWMAVFSAGTKLFTLKLIYAFLTGSIPGDYSYLNPSINIETSNSLNSTLDLRSTLFTEC